MSKFKSYNHKNIEDKIYKYWEKIIVLSLKKIKTNNTFL